MDEKKSSGIRVFVYGTLKAGRYNHDLLRDAELLGTHVLRGPIAMVDLAHYPCVVQSPEQLPETGAVLGEVYRIDEDTLAGLDLLEGHPSYFRRVQVETPWKKAWMYTLPASYLEHGVMPQGIWDANEDEEAEYALAVA
jgi:gamma-glutamylcyclotransferase (GGCT)/AIG2-like uncharacterized protein YtfP